MSRVPTYQNAGYITTRLQTTDASERVLATVMIQAGTMVRIVGTGVGMQSSGGNFVFRRLDYSVRNTGSIVAVVESANGVIQRRNLLLANVDFTLNGTEIELRATGEGATTINWTALLQVVLLEQAL